MESRWAARAVAMVGLATLALLALELVRPREYLTGTNGAGSQGPVVAVGAGQELCLPELDVPAGTRRVRLRHGPASAAVTAPVAPGRRRVCVRPTEAVSFHGRPGREADDPPALVDGRAIEARVEAVFLPAEGERRSLLGQLPDIARRASLFRPGWVGPWTYWALLLAVWPGLVAAGLWVLLRPPRRTALAVWAIGFGLSASWALLMPPFNAPDETEHFAYAQSLAERGEVPDLHPPSERRSYSSEQQVAWEGAEVAGQLGQREGRPPWLAIEETRWRARDARGPPADDGGGALTGSAYSPLYFAALAPAYAAGGSIFTRLTAMRLVSAALAGLVAAFAVLLVLELGALRWAAAGAGLLVAFQPMAAFIGGAVNNDAAINAAAAGLLWLLVRALRRGLSPRLAAAIGALVVIALFAKGSGAFLYPAAALALVGLARAGAPRGAWLRLAAGAAAAAIACVGLSNALGHSGWPLQPARVGTDASTFPTMPGPEVQTDQVLEHPVAYVTHLWELALPPLPGMEDLRPPAFKRPGYSIYVKRAWGAFGFASILFPGWVYAVIALAMAAVAALAIAAARRERAALRARAWPAAVLAVAGVGVILGIEAVWFSPDQRPHLSSYGRYAFPALAPAAALVAFAAHGLGRRAAPAVLGGLVTAVAALQLAAVWLTVSALYV